MQDRRLGLREHLEELRKRLFIAAVAVMFGTGLAFAFPSNAGLAVPILGAVGAGAAMAAVAVALVMVSAKQETA